MLTSAVLTLLAKDKASLKKLLAELAACSHNQRRVLSEASASDVKSFCARKKKVAAEINRLLQHMEQVRDTVGKDARERHPVAAFMDEVQKELRPLIQKIVDQEKLDQDFLSQLHKEMASELAGVEQAVSRLKGVGNRYVSGYDHGARIFEGEG